MKFDLDPLFYLYTFILLDLVLNLGYYYLVDARNTNGEGLHATFRRHLYHLNLEWEENQPNNGEEFFI